MNWAHEKLDHLLGWYSAQTVWMKLLCVLPVVIGVGVLVCLCLGTLGLPTRKKSTADAIHSEAQNVIEGLDAQLREASAKIRVAQDAQTEIGVHLEQVAIDTEELRTRVEDMTHEELKLFMEERRIAHQQSPEWGEYHTEPVRVTYGKYNKQPEPNYGIDSESGIPFNELKSRVKKRDK